MAENDNPAESRQFQMRPHRKPRSMQSVEAADGRAVMEFRSTFKIARDSRITGGIVKEQPQVKFR